MQVSPQLTPSELPNPHTNSLVPTLPVPDIHFHLWTHRFLRSLERDHTRGLLLHRPYYRPFALVHNSVASPPFLAAGSHYFEWHSRTHSFPVCVVVFEFTPLVHSTRPLISLSHHSLYSCQGRA
jgi:hypothetical protein